MNNIPLRTTVADFIASRLADSDKSQCQIAHESGFEKPNMISMLKTGATKLPLNRVAPLAKALNADPAHLLRLTLLEYSPDLLGVIEDIMQRTLLTANEQKLIHAYRQASGDRDAIAVVVGHEPALTVAGA